MELKSTQLETWFIIAELIKILTHTNFTWTVAPAVNEVYVNELEAYWNYQIGWYWR